MPNVLEKRKKTRELPTKIDKLLDSIIFTYVNITYSWIESKNKMDASCWNEVFLDQKNISIYAIYSPIFRKPSRFLFPLYSWHGQDSW